MKQLLSLILCGTLILSLCACSLLRAREETAPSTEAPTQPTVTAAPKKDLEQQLRDILTGTGSFYSRENRIYMTLEEYCVSGTGYESIPVTFTKAASLDMDRDGQAEILLWLSEIEDGSHFGTLILSRGEGRVEGQMFIDHDLFGLKTDGTFRWYGKHGSGGIASLGGPDLARTEKADYAASDETMVYFTDRAAFGLDEALPDEEAYRLANDIQDAKADVPWTDFPGGDPCAVLNGSEIGFRYLYRGFTPVRLDDRERFDAFAEIGTRVILDEAAWSSYMGRFCPGIPYYEDFDFSADCLLASVRLGSRPAWVQSSRLISLKNQDGRFAFEYDDTPDGCLALNTDEITHFYVEVLIIRKADLPANADELIFEP